MKKKILAIASSGGHWEQLLQLKEAWQGHDVIAVATRFLYKTDIDAEKSYLVCDAHLKNYVALIKLAFQVLFIVLKERPEIVITTGAAPGFFGVMFGKLTGSKTIWVDSLANINKLSRSGKFTGHFSDLWLTQWEHLAKPNGPNCKGKVI